MESESTPEEDSDIVIEETCSTDRDTAGVAGKASSTDATPSVSDSSTEMGNVSTGDEQVALKGVYVSEDPTVTPTARARGTRNRGPTTSADKASNKKGKSAASTATHMASHTVPLSAGEFVIANHVSSVPDPRLVNPINQVHDLLPPRPSPSDRLDASKRALPSSADTDDADDSKKLCVEVDGLSDDSEF